MFNNSAVIRCSFVVACAVHFWALAGKLFRTRCKHGTSPEFLEANWVDTRGKCGQLDVVNLLNSQCGGMKQCAFVPSGSRSAESFRGLESDLQVLIPDSCDDVNYRKLMGTYRCVGTVITVGIRMW